jgi:hypothetical protein
MDVTGPMLPDTWRTVALDGQCLYGMGEREAEDRLPGGKASRTSLDFSHGPYICMEPLPQRRPHHRR